MRSRGLSGARNCVPTRYGIAYQAIWFIRGFDVVGKNRDEGFEMLIKASS